MLLTTDIATFVIMFTANVYRIMIGCPGDVQEEVKIAKEVINHWTSIHAEQNHMVLLPIDWIANSYPEHGAHPQKILNKQLSDRSDLLIAIFGSRLGTPTDTSLSGTIEEIEEHLKVGKPVMILFRRLNDISNTSAEELSKLELFKKSIKDKGLYREYTSQNEFEKTFLNAIELFLSDHWQEEAIVPKETEHKVEFSDKEIELLKSWIATDNPETHSVKCIGGTVFFFGNLQCEVTSGRELVKYNDFLSRLLQVGFIEQTRVTRSGDVVYQLCVAAYDFIDSIDNNDD